MVVLSSNYIGKFSCHVNNDETKLKFFFIKFTFCVRICQLVFLLIEHN